jgi:hypothetical protein
MDGPSTNGMFPMFKTFPTSLKGMKISTRTLVCGMSNKCHFHETNVLQGRCFFKPGYFSTWDVSSVTDMPSMIAVAEKSTRTCVWTWITGNVSTMCGWDVFVCQIFPSKYIYVGYIKMNHMMFQGATLFDGDISLWTTSSVMRMEYYMFYGASYLISFHQNLSP